MPRPYVRKLYTYEQEPGAWSVDGFATAQMRPLSADPETGAATELLDLPAGWRAPAGRFGAGVEILVVDGGLAIGDYRLKRFSYSYLPAGVAAGPWSSPEGSRVLWMPEARLTFEAGAESRPGAHLERSIPQIDSSALPWQPTFTPGFPVGAMRKTLRIDPDTGAGSWLLGMLPQVRDTRREIHPTAEEAFTLLGEIHNEQGVSRAGAYFWRPPFIAHGPFHTDVGVLIFFRTDGPLRTDYLWPDR